jgi:hypothetical protein
MMIAHSAPLLSQTLSAVDLRDPEISALIAKKLREFNDLDMPGPKNVSLWQRLRHAVFLMILSYCGENEKMWLVADQKLICLVLCCMNQEVA